MFHPAVTSLALAFCAYDNQLRSNELRLKKK